MKLVFTLLLFAPSAMAQFVAYTPAAQHHVAVAPITVINTAQTSVGNSLVASLALPATSATAGNAIYVGVKQGQTNCATTTVTLSDTAGDSSPTPSITYDNGASDSNCELLFRIPSTLGNASNVITVHFSPSVKFSSAISMQTSGGSGVVDQTATGKLASGTSITSNSFTATVAGELTVAFAITLNGGQTFTAGSGFTLENSDSGQKFSALEYQINSGITTASITYGVTDLSRMVVLTCK